MNLAILGPPGSGKGTQAVHLAKQLQIAHISTGEILREAVRKKTPLGCEAKKFLEAGQLVPDAVVLEIVKAKMHEPTSAGGYILDGFPRTIPQAQMLDRIDNHPQNPHPPLEKAIYLEVSDEECVARLSERRTCPECGLTYNPVTHPPKKAETCDACKAQLILREDDRPETVRNRLQVYHAQTAPLIQYYEGSGRLVKINGNSSPQEIYKNIINLL